MAETGKKVEVRYGAFACSIEGYDNPVEQMREIIAMMQQMINETPQLGTTTPDFDADEVENILSGSEAGTPDSKTPGLIVIRNDDKPAIQPDDVADAAADTSLGEQENTRAEANLFDERESLPPTDDVKDDVTSMASDDDAELQAEVEVESDTASTIDLSAGLQSMAPVIPTVLDGLIPTSTPAPQEITDVEATPPEQGRSNAPSPADEAHGTDAPSTPGNEAENENPALQDQTPDAVGSTTPGALVDGTQAISASAPEPLNIFASPVGTAPTDTGNDRWHDTAGSSTKALPQGPTPLSVNIFSAPKTPESDSEYDEDRADDRPDDDICAGESWHETPQSEGELPPAKPFNIFAKPVVPSAAVDNEHSASSERAVVGHVAESVSDQGRRPFNIFTAPEEIEQSLDEMARADGSVAAAPETPQTTGTSDPSNVEPRSAEASTSLAVDAPSQFDDRQTGDTDQPFAFVDETSEPDNATVDLEAWPDAISASVRASLSPDAPAIEPDPMARPLTRDKPQNIFATPHQDTAPALASTAVNEAQESEPSASAVVEGEQLKDAERTNAAFPQSEPTPAAPLFSATEQDTGHEAADTRVEQALEEARRQPAGTGSRFDALLSRIHGQSTMGAPGEPSHTEAEEMAMGEASTISAADLAQRANADSVEDLLATAAGWLTLVKGRDRFTRREVMTVFEDLPGDHPRTLEARIKGYGKLVRNGTLILVDDGVFAMAQPLRDHFRSMIS